MRPPTITMTPTRKPANVRPAVARVARVRACTRAPASEPAMASASTIGANRPMSMVRPRVMSYHGVLGSRRVLVDEGDHPAGRQVAEACDPRCLVKRVLHRDVGVKPRPGGGHGVDRYGRVGCHVVELSLIHISEPTRLGMISYAVFCLK